MAALDDLDLEFSKPPTKAKASRALDDLDAEFSAPPKGAAPAAPAEPVGPPDPMSQPYIGIPNARQQRQPTPAQPSWSALGESILGGAADVAKYITSAPGTKRGFAGDVASAGADVNRGLWGLAQGGVENVNEFLPGKPLAPVTQFTNRMAGEAKRISEVASPAFKPGEGSPISRGVTSGVKSAGQSLLSLPVVMANPAAGLGLIGAITGGQSYLEARDKGISPPQAAIYGGSQGLIEGATETLPALRFIKDLRMGSTLGKTFKELLIRELPSEQAATLLQDANQKSTLEPEKTWGQYLAERPSAALDTAIATVVASGGMAGAGHVARNAAVRAAAASPDPGSRAEAAAYRSDKPADVLAAALGGEPVNLRPENLRSLRPELGAPYAVYGEPNASEQAPIPPAAAGPAAFPGSVAPAVPPAGGQLGGDPGLAGSIAPVGDPDSGAGPGAPVFGPEHLLPADDYPVDPAGGIPGAGIEPAAPGPGPALAQPGGVAGALGLDDPAAWASDDLAPTLTPDDLAAQPPLTPDDLAAQPPPADPNEETLANLDDLDELFSRPPEPEQILDENGEALVPGTPAYVERLREGFQPRVPKRDIAGFQRDINRAQKGQGNPLLNLLERYPLKRKEANDYGADFGKAKKLKRNKATGQLQNIPTKSSHYRYFRADGISVDALLEKMWQEGYITEDQMNDQRFAHDLVRQALDAGPAGEGPQPYYNVGYMELRQETEERARKASEALEAIEQVDTRMVENVLELAALDPEAFAVMLDVANESTTDDEYITKLRPLYNEYYARQRAAAEERAGRVSPGAENEGRGPDAAGNQGGRAGPPGQESTSEDDTESDDLDDLDELFSYPPDEGGESGMTSAEAEEYKALRRVPYDQRTSEQQERHDELDEDYSNYRREHLFDDPGEHVNASKQPGQAKSQDAADAQIEEWRRVALAQKGNSNKTVLSLFDATGAWTQPWVDAGYNVITVDIKNGQDINDLLSIEDIDDLTEGGYVDVVLAAIPCTDFAASGARWWADKDRDGVTEGSIELAQRALAIIEYLQPDVWAAENPVGRIQSLTRLPDPRLTFQPNDFGNPYTKKTLLYGQFNAGLPINRVEPSEGSKMHRLSSSEQDARSITPEGFAYAFFMANGGLGPVAYDAADGQQAAQAPDDTPDTAAHAEPDAPAPVDVGQEADTGVEQPKAEGLDSYTPEELAARDAERSKAEASEKKTKAEADAKAKADAERDEFTLTGSDRDADANPKQSGMFDRDIDNDIEDDPELDEDVPDTPPAMYDTATAEVPGGRASNRSEASTTMRASHYTDAWQWAGVDPGKAANMTADQQLAILTRVYRERYGITLVRGKGATNIEMVDAAADGFRNIGVFMQALGMPDMAASLEGRLRLSVEGMQGGYLGMYNPGTHTIHMPGRSNSFAHEWAHAFDHWMYDQIVGKASDPRATELLTYAARRGTTAKGTDPLGTIEEAFGRLVNAMYKDQAALAAKVLALQIQQAGKPTKAGAKALKRTQAGSVTENKDVTDSDYALRAAQVDLSSGNKSPYWSNPTEMFARAFESWIAHLTNGNTLGEFITKGDRTYLNSADAEIRSLYPQEADRQAIFDALNDLFSQAETLGQLKAMPGGNHVPGDAAFAPGSQDKIEYQGWSWGALKAMARAELAPWKNAKLWTPAGVMEGMRRMGMGAMDALHGGFAGERGVLNHLRRRYKSKALDELAHMLYRDLETGQTQEGKNLPQAIKMHATMMRNRQAKIEERYGLNKLNEQEERLLGFILTSQEDLANEDVRELVDKTTAEVSPQVQRRLNAAANELRKVLKDQWYYAKDAGIKMGATNNGYLARMLDREAAWAEPTKFLEQAGKVYGNLFDDTVGTDEASWDQAEYKAVLRSMGFTFKAGKGRDGQRKRASNGHLSGHTAQMVRDIARMQAQIKRIEKAMKKAEEAGEDVAPFLAQIADLSDQLTELVDEMLPALRSEYAAKAAEDWRSRIAIGDMNDFDTTGPSSSFTNGRTLPASADSLMNEFYLPPLERVRDYLERSTRKAEYVRRFGEADNDQVGSKLEQLLRRAEKEGVTGDQIQTVKGIVERATGRAKYAVPSSVSTALNWVNTIGQLVLLARAPLASLAETVVTPLRTGDMLDIVRPFGAMAGQVLRTKDANMRRELAEVIGAIARPFENDGMSNRLAGDSFSRKQSKLTTQFHERTLLSPLTRMQRTALVKSYHVYLTALAKGVTRGDKGTRTVLAELGIPPGQRQTDFAKWILSFNGGMPSVEQLMDPRTDRPGAEGADYASALNALIEGTVVEGEKIDKPALSGNPLARLAFAITQFNYAHWAKVYKPLLRKLERDIDTLTALRSGMRNDSPQDATMRAWLRNENERGETRLDAARSLAVTAGTLYSLYMATYVVNLLRQALFNGDKWDEERRKGKAAEASWLRMQTIQRMGIAGPADPLLQALMGLKYQRDLTAILAGPYAGTLLQNAQDAWRGYGMDPTSDREATANDRYKATKATYMSTAAVLSGVLAATLPGGPILGGIYAGLNAWLTSTQGAASALGAAGYEKPKGKKDAPRLVSSGGVPVDPPKKKNARKAEQPAGKVVRAAQ